ncbi:MAG: phosphate ABC transporter permease PstA [Treponema sp.]|jgi:phosphate transport system permease protein|nr:phosphate ABC transporter permease PstA [Treponema sp.]
MKARKIESIIIKSVVIVSGIICAILVLAIVLFIMAKGVPNFNLRLFELKYNSENASMFPAIINTVIIVLMTLAIALPIGVGGAIYLVEYSDRAKNPFVRDLVKLVRITTETLSGIPSIVFGLFGFLFFVSFLRWQFSLIAGSFTLSLMILPTIIRTTEEALLAVSDTYREASFGLGADKVRTIFKIVLPTAFSGIMNGVVLSIGRIIGETAALIYTAGTVAQIPKSVFGSGRTLAVHLYSLWCEGISTKQAYATAVVLLCMAGLMNFISMWIEGKKK